MMKIERRSAMELDNNSIILHVPIGENATTDEKAIAIFETLAKNMDRIAKRDCPDDDTPITLQFTPTM